MQTFAGLVVFSHFAEGTRQPYISRIKGLGLAANV